MSNNKIKGDRLNNRINVNNWNKFLQSINEKPLETKNKIDKEEKTIFKKIKGDRLNNRIKPFKFTNKKNIINKEYNDNKTINNQNDNQNDNQNENTPKLEKPKLIRQKGYYMSNFKYNSSSDDEIDFNKSSFKNKIYMNNLNQYNKMTNDKKYIIRQKRKTPLGSFKKINNKNRDPFLNALSPMFDYNIFNKNLDEISSDEDEYIVVSKPEGSPPKIEEKEEKEEKTKTKKIPKPSISRIEKEEEKEETKAEKEEKTETKAEKEAKEKEAKEKEAKEKEAKEKEDKEKEAKEKEAKEKEAKEKEKEEKEAKEKEEKEKEEKEAQKTLKQFSEKSLQGLKEEFIKMNLTDEFKIEKKELEEKIDELETELKNKDLDKTKIETELKDLTNLIKQLQEKIEEKEEEEKKNIQNTTYEKLSDDLKLGLIKYFNTILIDKNLSEKQLKINSNATNCIVMITGDDGKTEIDILSKTSFKSTYGIKESIDGKKIFDYIDKTDNKKYKINVFGTKLKIDDKDEAIKFVQELYDKYNNDKDFRILQNQGKYKKGDGTEVNITIPNTPAANKTVSKITSSTNNTSNTGNSSDVDLDSGDETP